MPFTAKVYRVLIASPADVADERVAIRQAVFEWNGIHALESKTVLLPLTWEMDAIPEMGDRPQSLINKQLVDEADFLVGFVWTRLGTPTGRAESGTVEEIREFLARGKPVLLYFSLVPALPSRVDRAQYERMIEFKNECRRQGIVFDYESIEDLRRMVHRHLLMTVRRTIGGQRRR